MAIEPGAQLGPYHVVRLLGSGGMGRVFEARDNRLGRAVAVKVSNQEFTTRFQCEARAIARLNHPNICTIHDVGPDYLVLELVEGETLAERIAQGPISVGDAIRIIRQVADALQAAHEQGIIHRDLKPANLKLKPNGAVKVLDFGVAKLLDERQVLGADEATRAITDATRAGEVIGTTAYMSPEQVQGLGVDARTDIWSVGILLYEMLTGRIPFGGRTAHHAVLEILEKRLPTGSKDLAQSAGRAGPLRREGPEPPVRVGPGTHRRSRPQIGFAHARHRGHPNRSPGHIGTTAAGCGDPFGLLLLAGMTGAAWCSWEGFSASPLLHRVFVQPPPQSERNESR